MGTGGDSGCGINGIRILSCSEIKINERTDEQTIAQANRSLTRHSSAFTKVHQETINNPL